MDKDEIIAFLRRAHYRLMGRRFWYDEGDMAASKILCVTASDMQAGFERAEGWWREEQHGKDHEAHA